jgi:uncharacterized membrane protein
VVFSPSALSINALERLINWSIFKWTMSDKAYRLTGAVIVLSLLLLSCSVYAQDVMHVSEQVTLKKPGDSFVNVDFLVKDAQSNQPINNVPIKITLLDIRDGGEVSFVKYLDNSGIFDYKLADGPWLLTAEVDDSETSEVDFFGEQVLSISEESVENVIFLIPVGAIEGRVVDEDDNLVNGADLQFICKSNIETDYPDKTNLFGTFTKKVVPVGVCKISAAFVSKTGSSTVEILQGQEASVNIILDQSIENGGTSTSKVIYVVGVIILIALIAALVTFFIIRKPKKDRGSVTEVQNIEFNTSSSGEDNSDASTVVNVVSGDDALNLRAKDILDTLNERERQIVEFLLESDNKSTQAKIRNSTGIPKTSLARIFLSLEKKKVLNIETIGKLKKINLTNWFLGKE